MASPAGKVLAASLEGRLAPLGPYRARPMFGGYGLYIDGTIFGLVVDGDVYLKVDDRNRDCFRKAGSHPFRYETRRGPATVGSYWRCPDVVMGDTAQLQEWVTGSLAASRQAAFDRKPQPKGKRYRRPVLP